jgi:hypothetical protein
MADNRNILIGLLVVVVILLAFLAFRQMAYSPTSSTGYYQPWQMGPGMMYGYGPGYSPNISAPQVGYVPGYWVGPGMMYGYGPGNSTSIAGELSKLDDLRKEGAITQDEYNKLKTRLID